MAEPVIGEMAESTKSVEINTDEVVRTISLVCDGRFTPDEIRICVQVDGVANVDRIVENLMTSGVNYICDCVREIDMVSQLAQQEEDQIAAGVERTPSNEKSANSLGKRKLVMSDAQLARQLQEEEEKQQERSRKSIENDEALALRLQEDEKAQNSEGRSIIVEADAAYAKELQRQLEAEQSAISIVDNEIAQTMQSQFDQEAQEAEEEHLFTCEICMDDEKTLLEMMMLDCDCQLKYCAGCMGEHIKVEMGDNGVVPKCPTDGCRRTLTEEEALWPFQYENTELREKVEATYLRAGLQSLKVVQCPNPGCNNAIVPSQEGTKEKCTCDECGMQYCSQCQEPFHYDTTCEEVTRLSRIWDAWIESGYQRYLQKHQEKSSRYAEALEKYQGDQQMYNEEVRAAILRRRTVQQDEEWKRHNCKRCPHCRRVINKLEGCDSMVCGRDTHQSNLQQHPGCGKQFSWSQALPYEIDEQHIEASSNMDAARPVAPEKASERITLGQTRNGETIWRKCDNCNEDLEGVAFQCINCEAEQTFCLMCLPQLIQGGHDGNHIFKLLGSPNA